MNVGIPFALASGVTNGVGYTVQKRSLDRVGTAYCSSPVWWVGLLLLIGAEVMGGVSYAWVPASVVVSLSSLSIVSSTLFASVRERVSLRSWVACGMIVLGCAMLGLATPDVDTLPTPASLERDLFRFESIVFQVYGVALCLVLHAFFLHRMSALAAYAGVVSSITSVYFRYLVTTLLAMDWSAFGRAAPYVSLLVVVTSGPYAAAYLEPLGLRRYSQSAWVPVHFASCLIAFGVAGEIVFEDFQRSNIGPFGVLLVGLGVLDVTWGIFLVEA